MRRNVTSTSELNLLVPLDKEKIMSEMKDSDCFGKEWDPEERECSMCSASVPCGIIFQDTLKAIKKKKEKDPFKKLEKVIADWQRSGEPATVKDMFEYFCKVLSTNDEEVVVARMKKFIKGSDDIYTKKGIFYSKVVDNE